MEFSLLTEKELSKYGMKSQSALLGGKEKIIGYKEEGELLAYASIGKMGDSVIIHDFYVREGSRGRGIGAALLNTICNQVMEQTEDTLELDYPQGGEDSARLEGMLFRRGFRMQASELTYYEIAKEDLKGSYLEKMEPNPTESRASVFPLQVVTAKQLKELILKTEEAENYIVSRANYLDANRKRSQVLLIEDKIAGVVLLEDTDEMGTVEVSLLYVDAKYLKRGLLMVREAFFSVMDPESGVDKIRFVCVNNNAKRLAEFLFPKSEGIQEWHVKAVLNKELYQKRG